MFEGISFIKPNIPFVKEEYSYAPMFRKCVSIHEPIESAELYVCGLGYGYYYLNGKKATEDLFTAPVSDYRKTLWYNKYDVKDRLNVGENIFAVICGNGWYNEGYDTEWGHDKAEWRDNPKFILKLIVNGKTVLTSDKTWKITLKSPVTYNQLRSGEYFDSRLYDENWTALDYDDSMWDYAVTDDMPPTGVFRECKCEPIRECEAFQAKSMVKVGDNRYVFDFGQNMSGYIRLKTNQTAGDEIVIRYVEEVGEDNLLIYNNMDWYHHGTPFQISRFICCGKEFSWKPQFSYYGFRYVELDGIKNPTITDVTAYFVHQDVETRSAFSCSNETLNKLFKMGQMATLSNMFYMPTDCPTREKLGWANDAQSSMEQFLTDFKLENLMEKWLIDIYDAMLPDGMLPGIIPTPAWGYEWGNGPVSEGVLFEIPYRILLHTGNDKPLRESYPYFLRSLDNFDSKAEVDGSIAYGLDDWATPVDEDRTKAPFVNGVLKIKFIKIAIMAAERLGEDTSPLQKRLKNATEWMKRYLNDDGTCRVNKQTTVAMLIDSGLYENLEPLKNQLKMLVEKRNFHHNCGMVGLPYLYRALNKCGLEEYAYRIITAKGFPSYSAWIEAGSTTLYERWNMTDSKNHHMYSDFMSWLIKTMIGINIDFTDINDAKVNISPYFFEDISFAKGYCDTIKGRISVEWKKENGNVKLIITLPENVNAFYKEKKLASGVNNFTLSLSEC